MADRCLTRSSELAKASRYHSQRGAPPFELHEDRALPTNLPFGVIKWFLPYKPDFLPSLNFVKIVRCRLNSTFARSSGSSATSTTYMAVPSLTSRSTLPRNMAVTLTTGKGQSSSLMRSPEYQDQSTSQLPAHKVLRLGLLQMICEVYQRWARVNTWSSLRSSAAANAKGATYQGCSYGGGGNRLRFSVETPSHGTSASHLVGDQ